MLLNATKRQAKLPNLDEIKIFLGWIKKEYGTEVIISFLAKMIYEHQNYGLTDIIDELQQIKNEVKNDQDI
ncbi:MAG TPA: hypothetical protein PL041_02290 [Melioribacteraceae bacterium]|nr:hypothetical protein [Melioribacteraceae bacterium]